MFSPSLRLSVPNDYLAGVTGVDQGKLLWPGDEGGMPWGCRGDSGSGRGGHWTSKKGQFKWA